MFWCRTDDPHHAFSADDFTVTTHFFYGWSNLHFVIPFWRLRRRLIRPFDRSYGINSTVTVSPGRILIRLRRILPEIWPKISCPLSKTTLNKALGSASSTLP